MSRTRFRPETDGFAFKNTWTFDSTEIATLTNLVTDAVGAIEIILSPIIVAALGPALAAEAGVPFIGPWLVYETIKKANDAIVDKIVGAIDANPYGLCGGMAFASSDYFLKGWVVPRGTGPNDQPQRTSATGTALRDYIWSRLIKSIEDNVGTFLQWMAVLHFEGGPGGTWLRNHSASQLTTLKARIDGGTPVTIGLIGTTWNPLDNHQVLCYGYEHNADGTTTLFLYDNNAPGVESTTKLDFSGSELSAVESASSSKRGPLRGFFCTTYGSKMPPVAVVLRSGLTITPPDTGVNEAVTASATAANIGFHASPQLQLLLADSTGTTEAEEATPASIAEGAAHSYAPHISFNKSGVHHVKIVAYLGTFAGISITKLLPPEGKTQSDTADVLVFSDRDIRVTGLGQCQVSNAVGNSIILTCDTSDMGPNPSFAWTVTGATVVSGANSNGFNIQLPSQAGVTVNVKVKVTIPNGAYSTGEYSFQTISEQAAGFEQVLCQISHLIFRAPFWYDPGYPDPGPEKVISIDPGDLVSIRDVATKLASVADAAAKSKEALLFAPGVRSNVAAKGVTTILDPVSIKPVGGVSTIAGKVTN
jgi:hypothetical protein